MPGLKTGQYGSYSPGNNFPQLITKLLPSRQIVHSTQQVVYLAHANMHTHHLVVHSGYHYCKQVLQKPCYSMHIQVKTTW